MTLLLSNVFTITGAAIFFVFGIVYFYKSSSVKNHCSTVQKKLEDLGPYNKIMLFALMRGAGGGAIALATIIIWLQLEYSKYMLPWISLAILITSSLFFLASLNAMLMVKRNTTIRPPITILILAMVFIVAGYLFNVSLANI
jgi:hypothetical protein